MKPRLPDYPLIKPAHSSPSSPTIENPRIDSIWKSSCLTFEKVYFYMTVHSYRNTYTQFLHAIYGTIDCVLFTYDIYCQERIITVIEIQVLIVCDLYRKSKFKVWSLHKVKEGWTYQQYKKHNTYTLTTKITVTIINWHTMLLSKHSVQ